MMKMLVKLSILCTLFNVGVYAQNVGVGTDNPQEFFSVGSSSQFRVNASGDLVRINNVQYNFPTSNSSGTLVNNGSGTLSWTNAPALAVTNFTGTLPALNGSNLTSLNAANLASGTVPTARLGSGTADATTFLRGDGSWQTPAGGSGPSLIGTSTFNGTSVSTSDVNLGSSISISSSGTYLVQIQFNIDAAQHLDIRIQNGATVLAGSVLATTSVSLNRAFTFVVVLSGGENIQAIGKVLSGTITFNNGVVRVTKLY